MCDLDRRFDPETYKGKDIYIPTKKCFMTVSLSEDTNSEKLATIYPDASLILHVDGKYLGLSARETIELHRLLDEVHKRFVHVTSITGN